MRVLFVQSYYPCEMPQVLFIYPTWLDSQDGVLFLGLAPCNCQPAPGWFYALYQSRVISVYLAGSLSAQNFFVLVASRPNSHTTWTVTGQLIV